MLSTKKSYSHIKKAERLEIAILLKKSYSIREIAGVLNRNPGTISREIKNNKVNGKYDPTKANLKAWTKRRCSKYQGMKIVRDIKLRNYVEDSIKDDLSPEQIAGRLREVDTHLTSASHRAVYKFIHSPYGGYQLEKHLRHQKKRKHYAKVTQLADRVFIDQRPDIIEEKLRFYDWEGDFIVSGRDGTGVLLVLYERKSQLGVIRKIESRSTEVVSQVFKEITGGEINFNSLTLDNDIAFRKHPILSKIIKAPIYFCHPYHSWEKGGVENFNKLIRQYIPKSSDISKFSKEYIQEIETKLNNRPRKSLNYKTPLEVLRENKQFQILNYFDIINLNINKQKTAQVLHLRV